MRTVGIIGAGAWGTALALVAGRAGARVVLQAHEPEVVEAINRHHENRLFLPGIVLPEDIRATNSITEAVAADLVLLVAPAQFARAVTREAAGVWRPGTPVVVCAKGIEQHSSALMSEVVTETLPMAPIAVLSGPSFAIEVARDLPAAVTLACADQEQGRRLQAALGTSRFRTYLSTDVIGAELGGAIKNVLAIACGIVEGRGMGENTRAALITRGLVEIARLGMAKGARPETLMGLSGIGDLTLTCNAIQSRNFSLGVALGRGESLAAILGGRKSVAEGVFTASSVMTLAGRTGVDMPICRAVDRILNHGESIDATIAELLARPPGWELPRGFISS